MSTNPRMDKPIVLVTGATEWLGGGVVQQLLERGELGVRALTRDPDSLVAKALAESGADIVGGDLDNLGGVREALAGCYAVFADADSLYSVDDDSHAPLNLLDAAADAGIGYFVLGAFSAPGTTHPTWASALRTKLQDYARSLQIRMTTVTVADYYERIHEIISSGVDSAGEALVSSREDGRIPGIASHDVAAAIAALFENRGRQHLSRIQLVGDLLTPWEYAVRMTPLAAGQNRYGPVPAPAHVLQPGWSDSRALEPPLDDADVIRTRELLPAVDDFEQWLIRRARSLSRIALPAHTRRGGRAVREVEAAI